MTESRKRSVTIFTIIVSLLPSILLLQFPVRVSVSSVSLWASAIIGYMGIVLLLWMYMLGTKSVINLVFRDLAPVLAIHKWLGKYGSIAVFLHPILVTIAYGESWLYSFIPKVATVADRRILLGQIAFWLMVLTWGISFFLRKKLSYRGWKYTHYLAYICVPFALLHVPDLGSQEQAHLPVKAYLFLLGLTYIVFVVLRIRGYLNLDRVPYVLQDHVHLTEIDHMMRLVPERTPISPPKRGQFVYLKLGFLSEDHPFSVTQYIPSTHEITVTYRQAGMYTRELQRLEAGARTRLWPLRELYGGD